MMVRGTGSSNPPPSSGESGANSVQVATAIPGTSVIWRGGPAGSPQNSSVGSSRLELFLRGEHRGPRCNESLEVDLLRFQTLYDAKLQIPTKEVKSESRGNTYFNLGWTRAGPKPSASRSPRRTRTWFGGRTGSCDTFGIHILPK